MNRKTSLVIGLISVMLLAQCETGPEPPSVQQISGNWLLRSAQRNFKRTNTLEGAVFVFSENGSMQSNLPLYNTPEMWQAAFVIDQDSLRQTGALGNMVYQIKNWTDSTLTLAFSARGIPFELNLYRVDSLPRPASLQE